MTPYRNPFSFSAGAMHGFNNAPNSIQPIAGPYGQQNGDPNAMAAMGAQIPRLAAMNIPQGNPQAEISARQGMGGPTQMQHQQAYGTPMGQIPWQSFGQLGDPAVWARMQNAGANARGMNMQGGNPQAEIAARQGMGGPNQMQQQQAYGTPMPQNWPVGGLLGMMSAMYPPRR